MHLLRLTLLASALWIGFGSTQAADAPSAPASRRARLLAPPVEKPGMGGWSLRIAAPTGFALEREAEFKVCLRDLSFSIGSGFVTQVGPAECEGFAQLKFPGKAPTPAELMEKYEVEFTLAGPPPAKAATPPAPAPPVGSSKSDATDSAALAQLDAAEKKNDWPGLERALAALPPGTEARAKVVREKLRRWLAAQNEYRALFDPPLPPVTSAAALRPIGDARLVLNLEKIRATMRIAAELREVGDIPAARARVESIGTMVCGIVPKLAKEGNLNAAEQLWAALSGSLTARESVTLRPAMVAARAAIDAALCEKMSARLRAAQEAPDYDALRAGLAELKTWPTERQLALAPIQDQLAEARAVIEALEAADRQEQAAHASEEAGRTAEAEQAWRATLTALEKLRLAERADAARVRAEQLARKLAEEQDTRALLAEVAAASAELRSARSSRGSFSEAELAVWLDRVRSLEARRNQLAPGEQSLRQRVVELERAVRAVPLRKPPPAKRVPDPF